jgi:hypothetical protein
MRFRNLRFKADERITRAKMALAVGREPSRLVENDHADSW